MADENDRTETSEANTPETEATDAGAPESGETEPTTAEKPAEEPVAAADEPRAAEARAAPRRRRAARRAAARADTDADAEKPSRAARRAAPAKAAEPAADGDRPVVRAHAKYVRSSARKARLVCDHIRGRSVEEARAILAFTPRAVAKDWSKLLESAVANAEHNHELDGDDLVIKAAHADEGPTLKRFRPRAMGRATPIRKRTSHLTILLAPKE